MFSRIANKKFVAVYCGKNVITFRISGSNKYQQVVLVVHWDECSLKVNFYMDGNLNAGKCGTANYSDMVW